MFKTSPASIPKTGRPQTRLDVPRPSADLVATMKQIVACLAICTSLCAYTQDGVLYNPDFNNDSFIGAPDLLGFLPFFGQPFTPFALNDEETFLEHTFTNDGEHLVIQPTEVVLLRQGQCGTSNSPYGVNCHQLEVEFDLSQSYPDLFEMRVFNAGTINTDTPGYYSTPVETFSFNGEQLLIHPHQFVAFVHLQGQWFVQNGPMDN